MTKDDQKIYDDLDWAFNEMEKTMKTLKQAGLDGMARDFGNRWVEVNDAFHAERANGSSGFEALKRMTLLEDEIVRALKGLCLKSY